MEEIILLRSLPRETLPDSGDTLHILRGARAVEAAGEDLPTAEPPLRAGKSAEGNSRDAKQTFIKCVKASQTAD